MVTTRPVSLSDLDLICRHREDMFRASNAPGRSDESLYVMTASFRVWIEPRLKDGSYFGYIVEGGWRCGCRHWVNDHRLAAASVASERRQARLCAERLRRSVA